jgi:MoaA/NifB/PqqE/SkfB family radical SAM enzyme
MLERLLYSPFLAQLVTIRRCNLSCGYCNEFDDRSPPVAYEALVERIDALKRLGTFSLELTGGEPLLHPRIFDVVAAARARRFHKVMMISNGFLLNEARVEGLNQAGLQALQISVDGVQPNATTVKTLKPLRSKLEVLAKHARFPVTLSAVVGAAPIEEVLEVVAFAKQVGFRPRVLVLHGGDGQAAAGDETLAALDLVGRAIGRRFKDAKDYRARLAREGTAPFKCRAGSRYLYVDEHGVVHWCSQTRSTFGVPLEKYDHAELRRQFDTPKPCSGSCTVGCARTNSAFDEWRAQAGAKGRVSLPIVTGGREVVTMATVATRRSSDALA